MGNNKLSESRKNVFPEEKYSATNFLTLWDFKGVLEASPLFYGWYSMETSKPTNYRLPLAYFVTFMFVYGYSFFAILRRMAKNAKTSRLSEKDDECVFFYKLFTAWDYMIGNAETAHNRMASIVMGFKEALLEEAEKKKSDRNWKIIAKRILVNLAVIGLFMLSVVSVVILVSRSMRPDMQTTFWKRNELTIIISLISLFFPMLFEALGYFEDYHPRKQLRIQLARIMALNLLNIYSLIISLFTKIHDLSAELDSYLQNMTKTKNETEICFDTCTEETIPFSSKLKAAALILNMSAINFANLNTPSTNLISNYNTVISTNFSSFVGFNPHLNSSELNDTSYISYYDYFEPDNFTQNFTPSFTTEEPSTLEGSNKIIDLFDTSLEKFSYYLSKILMNLKSNQKYLINNTTYSILNETDHFITTKDFTTENLDTTVYQDITSFFSSTDFINEINITETSKSEEILTTQKPVIIYVPTKPNDISNIKCQKKCINIKCNNKDYKKISQHPNFTFINFLEKKISYKDKRRLKRLCWETVFGQELMKLTLMDLIITFLSMFFLDFFRGIFVRVMNKCWCWDLEMVFPKYSDFKVAENILHLVNNQGMVWMGLFFSPGLIMLNVVKLFVLMYLRAWIVLTCNVPPEVIFRASRSNNFYYALLLSMLFLCVLPVGYATVWVVPSWNCGPFSGYSRIYHIFTDSMQRILPPPINLALSYIASPGSVIPLLVLLILFIYYLMSLTNSLREANAELKFQLRKERTEERRKMFQIVDRRRRVGTNTMDPNNPFHKWKKLLGNLPSGRSQEDGSKSEPVDTSLN